MALEDGARVDFTEAPPRAPRAAVFEAAERAPGLDALVLGRAGNVRYATGARQLWRTGANPFAPLCVVIPETGRIHLLSTWDDGIPPEIGHDDLYGMFWNPAHLIAALAGIPGLAEARRVGTDSLTPFFGQVLAGLVPNFELVDASGILTGLRAREDGRRAGLPSRSR